jgi:hypothetical protein
MQQGLWLALDASGDYFLLLMETGEQFTADLRVGVIEGFGKLSLKIFRKSLIWSI